MARYEHVSGVWGREQKEYTVVGTALVQLPGRVQVARPVSQRRRQPVPVQQGLAHPPQRVVDAVHEEGGLVIKHSDGNLWPILDLIVGTGVEAINPLEPVAGMDIAKVKAEYGDRVCLVGNIDCGELLSHGTVEQVVEEVRQCIAAAAPGGGYMLSSSNSIHSSVNPGNYVAMVRAGHKYGRYDVDVEARS